MKNCLIRADASTKIGHGHIMRCLTLAQALNEYGVHSTFITRQHDGHLNALILAQGFPVISLNKANNSIQNKQGNVYQQWLGVKISTDANDCIQQLEKHSYDYLIVDHYALDNTWHQQLRPYVKKVIVIDDLADRTYDCDVLLDMTLDRQANDYKTLVPNQCKLLLGPHYALLRPQFARLRKASLKQKQQTNTVKLYLVSMGGSDPDNTTLSVLKAMHDAQITQAIEVIIAKDSAHKKSIEQYIKQMNASVTIHSQVNDMAHMMAQADIAIGAAGTTSWERCCLALPSIILITEANQQYIASALEHHQCIINLGDIKLFDEQKMVQALHNIKDQKLRHSLAQKSATICDGQGAQRVAKMIIDEH